MSGFLNFSSFLSLPLSFLAQINCLKQFVLQANGYSKGKRFVGNIQNDIDRELRLSELKEQMDKEMQRIAELEQKMQAQMQEIDQSIKSSNMLKDKVTTFVPLENICYVYRTEYQFITAPIPSPPQLKIAV